MTSTLIEFKRGIYEEHLEEVSFLYQQRVSMLADPHQPWMATEPFEDRLEAHLDALVLGATDAMQLCRERSAGGDAGDVFALTAEHRNPNADPRGQAGDRGRSPKGRRGP